MNEAALFRLLWLIDLQLSWTQRNKEICTIHQREKFKIGAVSCPISYSQISPSTAESLSLLLQGQWEQGRGGGGVWGRGGCLLLLPGCTSFIFLIRGVGWEGGWGCQNWAWRHEDWGPNLNLTPGGGERWGGEKEGGWESQSQQELLNRTRPLIYHPPPNAHPKPLWNKYRPLI